MVIVTVKHLAEAAEKYPDAATALAAWQKILTEARWHNFAEVRSTAASASYVDDYVVFNIRGNTYRLITVIHYAKEPPDVPSPTQGHVYIRSLLTHAEYDDKTNWDPFKNE